jgi:FkbM family methyltransferase
MALEPNPVLCGRLPKGKPVMHVAAAAGAEDGICRFKVERDTRASRVISDSSDDTAVIQVPMWSPRTVLAQSPVDRVALLKIDIEGQEIAVLDAMRDDQLLRVDQLSVEFHVFNGLVSREAVVRIIRRMQSLKFYCIDFSQSLCDVWMVHPSYAPPPPQQLMLKGLRLQRGLRRRLSRGRRSEGIPPRAAVAD